MIHANKVCCFLFLIEVPLVQRVGKNTRFLHVLSTELPQLLLQTEKKNRKCVPFHGRFLMIELYILIFCILQVVTLLY